MAPAEATARAVAVVGSGVAGLTAAYVLARRDRVTLFEADDRLGGHAHTHRIDSGAGAPVALDSAFLVHNDRTYPTLCRLFAELGVATRDTDMSMSVRADGAGRGGLEYAGARGVGGLFPSAANLLQPRYLRLLVEVRRFHAAANRLLERGEPPTGDGADSEPLSDFIARERFSDYFVDYFLRPLVAAVWSCAPGAAMRYPARYLFTFLHHHGMLSVSGSPTWRTVVGGSATYVEAIAALLPEICTGTPVTAVRAAPDGVWVQTARSAPRRFDAVVVATHPDQALRLLSEPTPAQRSVLGAMPYSVNHAQLHTDATLLPRRPRARASWNYLAAPDSDEVLVTYDITRLMRLSGPRRFLVTLGGRDRVDPGSVLAQMTYAHPLYTPESVAAQRLLPSCDQPGLVFAGAYHGWGFHEDGAASGVAAAHKLGVAWSVTRDRRAPVATGVPTC